MRYYGRHSRRYCYGGVLLSTLAFAVVIAMLLAGIATLTVSHYARVHVEADYAATLDLAEAGVNFELRKSAITPLKPIRPATEENGVAVQFRRRNLRVYCANTDGTTPWVAPNLLLITSVGTLNGVRAPSGSLPKAIPGPVKYAIYSIDHISVWHGSAVDIPGDWAATTCWTSPRYTGISGSV